MAKCNLCGKEAGYLHSICVVCKPDRDNAGFKSITPNERNSLRLAPGHRSARAAPWKIVVGLCLGVPVLVYVSMLAYGFSVPRYQRSATQIRKVCLDRLVQKGNEADCNEMYEKLIREGKAATQNK